VCEALHRQPMTTEPPQNPPAETGVAEGAARLSSAFVAAGILLSRIAGLIRERVFGHYFGTTLYADVFRAGLRMPNVLQNLLGEGTLSASFIPVYSELLEEGREEEAGRTAGAIFGLLLAIAGGLALVGVLLAAALVSIFLPGFEGERRELAIAVVRIIFPMTGILVLSAWALGILNSHRKFFISYVAPVLWNGAMIAALVMLGGRLTLDRLVIALAWGALIGGVLQFGIQLPWVLRLERRLRPSFNFRLEPVREAIRNAGPAIVGRGVVQISGYVDIFLASLLAAGAVAAIGYAQTLYMLPVSLFGMSVAAAELPELSRHRTSAAEELRVRTNAGLERIAFFVVPSFVAFLLLGDAIVGALYQTGEFGRDDTLLVYLTLAGFSIGLIASTGTRLFASTFFALRDTRTPARFAIVRVAFAATLGSFLMIQFEPVPALGIGAGLFGDVTVGGKTLGAVGLATGSGIAAWVEWTLLRRKLRERIGPVGAGAGKVARMLAAAGTAAVAGWSIRWLLGDTHPLLAGIFIFAAFGLVYFAVAAALQLSEARLVRTRLLRLVGRKR
jgi:putative peptidoglycan lipid II flippase